MFNSRNNNMITMQASSVTIRDEKRTELMSAIENGEDISVEITKDKLHKINEDSTAQDVEL